ncbi:FecR family protein [Marinimicrobium agarilyticum]|uniref:FecR family protein n=1 Tax=Marinimicrobium agarilyticum TaxID=306546 RepID=UPI0003FFC1F6|nr:FecR domain-containing protein [Marinimicrobium agarilyticum]
MSSKSINTHAPRTAAYEEAAAWLERLSDGELDKVSAHRFNRWLNTDDNQALFDRLLRTWSDPALTEAAQQSQTHTPLRERYRVASRAWHRFWWGGAVLASLLLAVWLVPSFYPPATGPAVTVQSVATGVGAPKDLTLADGSSVHVAALSSLEVRLEETRRLVALKRGAAYFAVAPDKQRPFSVQMGRASVTAVGTAFNIDRTASGIDVTVHEGAIEVRAHPDAKPSLLRAGERVRITETGLSEVQAVALAQLVDWRSGWVEVQDETLAFLLEKLSRHSPTPIRLASAELGELRVAGRFRLQDTDTALTMLSQLYPLKVDHQPGRIWIEPASD